MITIKSSVVAIDGADIVSRVGQGNQTTILANIGWTTLVLSSLGFWSVFAHGTATRRKHGETDVEERCNLPSLNAMLVHFETYVASWLSATSANLCSRLQPKSNYPRLGHIRKTSLDEFELQSDNTESNERKAGEGVDIQERESHEDADTGNWTNLDHNVDAIPTEQPCFYCCEEGNVLHPLERFTCYPCCGYNICLDCMSKSENATYCAECFTRIPFHENENAMVWIQSHMQSRSTVDNTIHLFLIGRVFLQGYHTCLNELMLQPLFDRIQPPSLPLSKTNPPDVQTGVKYLTAAANGGQLVAMIHLAEIYNDCLDNGQADYWFRKALWRGKTLFPLALTRYGDFLECEGMPRKAMRMFEVAGRFGHARGQYEYAKSLLQVLGREPSPEEHVCSHGEMTQAIEWLCKASARGSYIPSYVYLAKLLIDIAEKEYGTAADVGNSPLPRALQILSLVKNGGFGDSESVQNEAAELLERYSCANVCSSCGSKGSKEVPVSVCSGCGVVAYCSKICQRRGFRDGHRLDCCSREFLFDFHFIKLSLPWIPISGRCGRSASPSLKESQTTSLMQMVEDDTDETYGENEIEYDKHILAHQMLRMRVNLETYLDGHVKTEVFQQDGEGALDVRNMTLKTRIDAFAERNTEAQALVRSMHEIREYGFRAARHSSGTLELHECEEAVRTYRKQKEEFETYKAGTPAAPSQSNTKSSSKNGDLQTMQKEALPSYLSIGGTRCESADDVKASTTPNRHDDASPLAEDGAGTIRKRPKRKTKRKKKR